MKSTKLVNAVLALMMVVALAVMALPSGQVGASSHREAPMISKDPTADVTDVYAFVSPDMTNTVTLISNWIPLQQPHGGPNFYTFDDSVLYEMNVDTNGDGRANVSYQFKFRTEVQNDQTFLYNTGPIGSLNDPDYNIRQYYDVIRVTNY